MTSDEVVEPERDEEVEAPAPRKVRGNPLASLLVLCFLGLVGYNLFFVCQLKQVEYEEKLGELQQVQDDIYRAEIRNRRLAAQVKHLRTSEGVEEIAREKLGLVSPGEMAFVVVPPPPASSTTGDDIPKLKQPKPSYFQQVLHNVLIK